MANQRSVEFDFTGQAEQLIRTLDNIERHIRRVPEKKQVDISAKTAKARGEIDLLLAKLRGELEKEHDVTIRAKLTALTGDIVRARGLIATIPDRKTLTVNMRGTIFGRLANSARLVEGAVAGVEKVVKGTADEAAQAVPAVTKLGSAFDGVTGSLRSIQPIMSGIIALIVGALIPAIILLGNALVGAAGGAGALAVGFGATLAPALVAAVGVFGRFSAIFNVFQLRQQAMNQALKSGGKSASDAAAQEVRLRNARRSLGDASRTVSRAEDALQQARQQARENIAQSEKALSDARQNAATAARDLARAEVDAYRQIRDAIEAASDAQRDYKRAKLDATGAKLDTRQAKLDLKELRGELGLTGKAFDSQFKKFEDVRVDFGGVKGALAKVGQAQGLDPQQQIDLERAVLRVKQAVQGEADATDNVSDAAKTAKDTQKEATRLRKGGIGAVDSYRSALERNQGAQETLNTATKDYNGLVKKGVEGAPGVVSAHQAVGDAIRNEKRQHQDLETARKKEAGSATTAASALDTYRKAREKLTKGEQAFLDAIKTFKREWDKLWKSAAAPVVTAATDVVKAVGGILPKIRKPMTDLTTEWGNFIKGFTREFTTPASLGKFKDIFDGLLSVTRDLGGAFTNTFGIFLNIASAVMPDVKDLAKKIKDMTGDWKKSTDNIGELRKKIHPMVVTFERLATTIGLILQILFDIFQPSAKPTNDALGNLNDSLRDIDKWAKSPAGKKQIRDFFTQLKKITEETIPLLFNLGITLINAFLLAEPTITRVLDKIDKVVGFVNKFLGLLRLLGPLFTTIGTVATDALGNLGAMWIPKPFRDFIRMLGGIPGLFTKIKDAAPGAMDAVATAFSDAWTSIKGVWSGIPRFIQGIWDHVKSISTTAASAIGGVFRGIGRKIGAAFGGMKAIVATAFNGVISVINFAIDQINKIHLKLPAWLGGHEFKVHIEPLKPIALAEGGIAAKPTVAMIGEAGKEALLPLTQGVYKQLGASIAAAMRPVVGGGVGAAAAAAGAGQPGQVIYDQKILINSPPATYPDARHSAAALAKEMKRRGG